MDSLAGLMHLNSGTVAKISTLLSLILPEILTGFHLMASESDGRFDAEKSRFVARYISLTF
jgi:hypothetical protein